jgi:hypothetical protein
VFIRVTNSKPEHTIL